MTATTGPREPVTLDMAAAITGRPITALRHLVRERKVQAKACLVATRALIYELWEIEAALDSRRSYRRVAERR